MIEFQIGASYFHRDSEHHVRNLFERIHGLAFRPVERAGVSKFTQCLWKSLIIQFQGGSGTEYADNLPHMAMSRYCGLQHRFLVFPMRGMIRGLTLHAGSKRRIWKNIVLGIRPRGGHVTVR